MSHLSPKEKAQDLWAKLKDLAEREGGLLDASVVDLFTAELEAWKKDITAKADEPTDIVDWDESNGWMYYGGPSLAAMVPDTPKVWYFINTGVSGWTCDMQHLIDANPQWTFHIRKTSVLLPSGNSIWEVKADWDACTREWWQQNYDPEADVSGILLLEKMYEKGMFGPRKFGVF